MRRYFVFLFELLLPTSKVRNPSNSINFVFGNIRPDRATVSVSQICALVTAFPRCLES